MHIGFGKGFTPVAFLTQPSTKSALTRATLVLGHSNILASFYGQFSISNPCLWKWGVHAKST